MQNKNVPALEKMTAMALKDGVRIVAFQMSGLPEKDVKSLVPQTVRYIVYKYYILHLVFLAESAIMPSTYE